VTGEERCQRIGPVETKEGMPGGKGKWVPKRERQNPFWDRSRKNLWFRAAPLHDQEMVPSWARKGNPPSFSYHRCDRVPVFDIQKSEPLQASVIITIACLLTTASWNLSCCTAVNVTSKKNAPIRFDLAIERLSPLSGKAQ
jgi:hypothetical protein